MRRVVLGQLPFDRCSIPRSFFGIGMGGHAMPREVRAVPYFVASTEGEFEAGQLLRARYGITAETVDPFLASAVGRRSLLREPLAEILRQAAE